MIQRFRRAGGAVCGAGMFLLYFAALLFFLHGAGTNGDLYFQLQMKADILHSAGITRDELRSLDQNLAAYLAGDAAALDETPFNERERLHMADCFDLFVLLRRTIAVSVFAAAASLFSGLRSGFRKLKSAAVIAAMVFSACIFMLGIWGAADFDSLFILFHRLLFSNNLWMLNPETDLLIRICPQSMFSAMAAIIAGLELAFILLCCFLVSRRRKYL